MQEAGIEAAVLNENASRADALNALNPNNGGHLLFTSPEYLLHNPRTKEFCADGGARTCILGVLVDEGHFIREWADNSQKDYNELTALRVTLGNNAPWWVLSGTFTTAIFTRNTRFRPMGPAADTFLPLIPFIPAGAQARHDIPKTFFFRSISETRDAHLAIQALLPSHLHPSIQLWTGLDEETTKEKLL